MVNFKTGNIVNYINEIDLYIIIDIDYDINHTALFKIVPICVNNVDFRDIFVYSNEIELNILYYRKKKLIKLLKNDK